LKKNFKEGAAGKIVLPQVLIATKTNKNQLITKAIW